MPSMRENSPLFDKPNGTSTGVTAFAGDDIEILGTDQGWTQIRLLVGKKKPTGWVRPGTTGDAPAEDLFPFSEKAFAEICLMQARGIDVNPHYMLAVAKLRSGLAAGNAGDKFGPFRLTQTQWDDNSTDQEFNVRLDADDIKHWHKHPLVFALMVRRAEKKFGETSPDKGPTPLELYKLQWPGEDAAPLTKALQDTTQLQIDAEATLLDPLEEPTPAPANGGWAQTPRVGEKDWHRNPFGSGQEWRYDDRGIRIARSEEILQTNGAPTTCAAIVSIYGDEILKASMKHGVPPELIVMTIATESAADRASNFTGPRTFRWEAHISDYSAGPMQTLAGTAREVIQRLHLDHEPLKVAPRFATRPSPPPADIPLYSGDVNIDIGTAEIKSRLDKTKFDPILVAAAYNAGSLRKSTANPWGLVTHGDHLNRASQWFGDACRVLAPLRQGAAIDPNLVKSPKVKLSADQQSKSFEMSRLTKEAADDEVAFYRDSGATVELIDNGGGLFTVRVTYPIEPAPVVTAPADVPKPNRDGYVLVIMRLRTERRGGQGFDRTVGVYQAFFNREPIPGISGTAVERQAPGDNSIQGVHRHNRIEDGEYPLFTHAGGGKYRTLGFSSVADVGVRPWPSIRVENTGNRSGILIHCAAGYLMSIGCINLASELRDAKSNIVFEDSRNRVIALINSMKRHLGDKFPSRNDKEIPDTVLEISSAP